MKMTKTKNFQDLVADFMYASGQKKANVLTDEIIEFRQSLLTEEVEELQEALKLEDVVEQLDAICDILYILLGTSETFGIKNGETVEDLLSLLSDNNIFSYFDYSAWMESLKDKNCDISVKYFIILRIAMHALNFSKHQIVKGFHRVHESNMTKFPKTEAEALASIQKYDTGGIDAEYIFRNGLYVILRKSDKKVLKSINYRRVNLIDLV